MTGLILIASLFVSSTLIALSAETHNGGLRKQTAFLGATDSAALRSHLHQAIEDSLGTAHGRGRREAVQQQVTPMWNTLAKNSEGRIDQRSLQYVVYRFLHKTHGISITAFEGTQANQTAKVADLLARQAPARVKELLENNTAASGYNLQDVVAMIVMFEHLTHWTAMDLLDEAASARQWGQDQPHLDRKAFQQMMQSFLFEMLLGDDVPSIDSFRQDPASMEEMFGESRILIPFIEGRVHSYLHSWAPGRTGRWNPMRQEFSYADAQNIAGSTMMTFRSWWAGECDNIKAAMVAMDRQKNGRVRLGDFHAALWDGEWHFSESQEYLRNLGVLDETSELQGPRIIVPNYVQGVSNCFPTSPHFRICCKNECEDYMGELEDIVQSPLAKPEQILAALANMTISLDDDAIVVTRSLRSQLYAIAKLHDGKVPLHGRLFAQWMHYLLPQECAFPHKAGTTFASSPQEFGKFMATAEEVRRNARQAKEPVAESSSPCELGLGSKSGVACHHEDIDRMFEEEELLMLHQDVSGGSLIHFALLAVAFLSLASFAFASSKATGSDTTSVASTALRQVVHAASWSAKAHVV